MLLRIQSIISFICHSLFLLLLVRFFITLFAIYFVTYKFCCIFLYLTSKRKQNSRSISRMLWNMNQIIVWITIEIMYYWSVTQWSIIQKVKGGTHQIVLCLKIETSKVLHLKFLHEIYCSEKFWTWTAQNPQKECNYILPCTKQ